MTATLVDSNVLLDVFTEDGRWFDWSAAALADAAEQSRLVVNTIVYAEISVRFSRIEDLDDAVSPDWLAREAIPWQAAFLAAKVFRTYRRRGGTRLSTLPDFFIGAHAAVMGYRLLTRDVTRYRRYFPTVDLVAP
jgi:hypothetical protein